MQNTGEKTEKQALLLEDDAARLEEELSGKYYQLGKCVYEVADRRVEEINRLVDALVEAKLALVGAKQLQFCGDCRAANPRDNLYCGQCGAKLVGGQIDE